ncbi:DUF7313 family protein [Haloarchaeobius sp. DT45]|uniref:DUF7313 family protein n=1 Tax=Haloarchaeobius sp. DT45 TaxID=3446116 RepID=UPI003F6AB7E0
MDPDTMFGPLDQVLAQEVVGGVLAIEYLLLVLVVLNMGTRFLSYRNDVKQAEQEDTESLSRWMPHEFTNVVLILATFYYTTVEPHGGVVLSMLVVGMFLADFFEFEVREVDVRKDAKPRAPKGALGASVFVLAYAGFQSLFFLVKGLWTAVV